MIRSILRLFRRDGRVAVEPEPEAERAPEPEPQAEAAAPLADAGEASDYLPDRFALLAVINKVGSVEHYFHFVLGYVAPLLLREAVSPPGLTCLVRSCGPLDRMFAELGLADIRQVPKADWRDRRESGRYKVHSIYGQDRPEDYDPVALARLRVLMLERLAVMPPDRPAQVLLVNRGRSPDAYQATEVENPTSANLRRSVPNMAEVAAALTQAGTACRLVELEETTLRAQVVLFAATSTLVAQHGAALVNMVWMAPGGLVVEILPEVGRAARIFPMLAAACGHRYVSVAQRNLHAPADVAAVVDAVGPAGKHGALPQTPLGP